MNENVPTPCGNPNKLWPGVKCTKPQGHEGLHAGTNSLGVWYEWRSDLADFDTTAPVTLKLTGIKPTVGRIVHYTNLGDRDGRFPPEVQAALITKATATEGEEQHRRMANMPAYGTPPEHIYKVSLCVFYETGSFFMQDVRFTSEPAGSEGARGKWTWPKVER